MGILRRRGTSTLEKLIFGFCILCCSRTILGAIYKAPCKVDLECHSLYNKNYHCEEYHCRRPKFDTSTKDIIGYIVIVLISSISNAGGMGAGSIIIPAYMAFYNFVATDAIPLSKLTIFAGASTNFILSWSQRDPKKQSRFLINYNMASYMVPMLLSGTQVGVLLAKFLPPALIWIGLLSYMLISIAKVFKRGYQETQKRRSKAIETAVANNIEPSNTIPSQNLNASSHSVLDAEAKKLANDKYSLKNKKKTQQSDPQTALATPKIAVITNPTSIKKTTMNVEIVLPSPMDSPNQTRIKSDKVRTCTLIKAQIVNFILMIISLGVVVTFTLLRKSTLLNAMFGLEQCQVNTLAFVLLGQIICIILAFIAYRSNIRAMDEQDENDPVKSSLE